MSRPTLPAMTPPRSPTFGEMLDTPPAVRRAYYARLAAMPPGQRLAMAYAQTRTVRSFAESAIRREHPGIGAAELRARLAVRLYGRSIAASVLHIPADAR